MSDITDIEYFKELCAQGVLPSEVEPVGEEFDRFIREIRAEAWGEGATTALVHAGFVVPYDAPIFAINPYGEAE